jgi:tRNA threonylcarbamoyladenosine biosynthesis protein TsaE
MSVETRGPEETRAFAVLLAENLKEGDFIALEGEMAAGKTCFVQGLAAGLGYTGPATSPTFTLLHMYEGGRLPLYHFDVYRLETARELENIGYEDYFYGDGVCVVEWSNLAGGYLPERRIEIRLDKEADDMRRITVTPLGGDEAWRRNMIVTLK